MANCRIKTALITMQEFCTVHESANLIRLESGTICDIAAAENGGSQILKVNTELESVSDIMLALSETFIETGTLLKKLGETLGKEEG